MRPSPALRMANSGASHDSSLPQLPIYPDRAHHTGRKVCISVGTVAGAASGIAAATCGARIGATVGAFAGPVGSAMGGLAGALLGGLVGGVAGGSAGAALGDFVDEHILDIFECMECGHTFSANSE